jgi:hypothetical protein
MHRPDENGERLFLGICDMARILGQVRNNWGDETLKASEPSFNLHVYGTVFDKRVIVALLCFILRRRTPHVFSFFIHPCGLPGGPPRSSIGEPGNPVKAMGG